LQFLSTAKTPSGEGKKILGTQGFFFLGFFSQQKKGKRTLSKTVKRFLNPKRLFGGVCFYTKKFCFFPLRKGRPILLFTLGGGLGGGGLITRDYELNRPFLLVLLF